MKLFTESWATVLKMGTSTPWFKWKTALQLVWLATITDNASCQKYSNNRFTAITQMNPSQLELHAVNKNNNNRFMEVQDYPVEPVPEETFTHPPS